MIEELLKNLDDDERNEAERNKATGFNIFTAAKVKSLNILKIFPRENANIDEVIG